MGLNVSIGADLAQYVERKIEAGQYGSAEEMVEFALRVLRLGDRDEPIGQTDDEKLTWLRSAYLSGLASGSAGPVNFASVKAEARRRRAART